MASPRFDLLTAVRASTVYHKLNAGAVSAVAARFPAFLTIMNGVFMNIIARAFGRRVAPLPPFVHRIEAWATVGAAVFATFLLKLADV